MKKPKAKKIDWNKNDGWSKEEQVGRNQAINDSDAYWQHLIKTKYVRKGNISIENIRMALLENIGWFILEWDKIAVGSDKSNLLRKLATAINKKLVKK